MSKIGLIGGTGPESTVIYYRDIVYGVQTKTGKAFFPNMAIESLSVFDVLGYCERQDYKGLVSYLLAGIQNLEGAGVQCAALTGITPHIVFDELEKCHRSLLSVCLILPANMPQNPGMRGLDFWEHCRL
jgi:aspartate racemase